MKVLVLKLLVFEYCCLIVRFGKSDRESFQAKFQCITSWTRLGMQLNGAVRPLNKSGHLTMILTFVGSPNVSDRWRSILPTTFNFAGRCDRLQEKRLTLSSHFIHLPLADGEKLWHHPSSVFQPSGLLIFPDWCLSSTAAAFSRRLTWAFISTVGAPVRRNKPSGRGR